MLAKRFGVLQQTFRTRSFSTLSENPRILITGSCGQIGVSLVKKLRELYGNENVLATDIVKPSTKLLGDGPFAYANALDERQIERLVVENGISWIVHNSSLLSATAEKHFQAAFDLNFIGLKHVLEVARKHNCRIFAPSSIAAFGVSTPLDNVPDLTIQRPSTIYGVSKVYLELLGEYYHTAFGVDFRSLRYPGVISPTPPGGGTTDYAVDIFFQGLKEKKYECFLREDTLLPMMYMPDCIKATVDFLAANPKNLGQQRTYNIAAFSFTPSELEKEVKKYIPELEVTYKPDSRQKIADTWPKRLDDSLARAHWGWKPDFDLSTMTKDMIQELSYLRSE